MGKVPSGYGRYITITPAESTSHVCNVMFQVVDAEGNAVADVLHFDVYLSDSAVGVGLTSTSSSSAASAGSGYGAIVGILTAKKAWRVQTNASGQFQFIVTDTSDTGFYPCATIPGGPNNGRVVVGDALTDYGS